MSDVEKMNKSANSFNAKKHRTEAVAHGKKKHSTHSNALSLRVDDHGQDDKISVGRGSVRSRDSGARTKSRGRDKLNSQGSLHRHEVVPEAIPLKLKPEMDEEER